MIELTRPGKNSLTVETPVMPASGTFGFGDLYRDLIDIEKLGALVTNPVTYQPWNPAGGTRVVRLDAGILMHTGLPNPGLGRTLARYRAMWKAMPVPVILHVVATNTDDVRACMAEIEREDSVQAVELGLNDEVSPGEAGWLVRAATEKTEKPLIVRLPLNDADRLARAAVDSGADAVVVCAPPRGTARDSGGKLIGGRIYGPLVKPMILRLVGQIARVVDVPVIGAGGIHNPQDARDYIEAGARAVQVDSVTWIEPKMLEIIARDLGGLVLTRASGAYADEWHPGIGETERRSKQPPAENDSTQPLKS